MESFSLLKRRDNKHVKCDTTDGQMSNGEKMMAKCLLFHCPLQGRLENQVRVRGGVQLQHGLLEGLNKMSRREKKVQQ